MAAPRLYALGAAFFFSTGGAAIKLSGLSSWQIAGFRSGLAALLLWWLVPAWRRWWSPPSLAVGVAFGATLVLFVTANTLTTAVNAIFLQYSAPLYLLLLGPWLLGEPNRRSDLGLIALLAIGMLLFFIGQETPSATAPDPLRGNFIGACAGFSWALTLLGMRWLARQPDADDAGGSAIIAGNVLAFAVCLPWALPMPEATPVDWAVVVYLAVFQIGVAYLCLLRGIRKLRALEISLLLSIEPVASGVWAWLVHGEIPGTMALLGCTLIFSSVLLQALRKDPTRPPVM
ncbi:MAG: DMT family transporter [Deltaproteobacteria bacterium]|nr:DMT family transporter [Deltaproteobacteria bacterium]MBW2691514.1 DMT family transporter [Deltaproteobacteria bacterium]